jgi:hypothetical protein
MSGSDQKQLCAAIDQRAAVHVYFVRMLTINKNGLKRPPAGRSIGKGFEERLGRTLDSGSVDSLGRPHNPMPSFSRSGESAFGVDTRRSRKRSTPRYFCV